MANDAMPQWQEEWHKASHLSEDNPAQAISMYRYAVDDAKVGNAPAEKQLSILLNFGQFLCVQSQFKEAKDIYARGAKLAHDQGNKNWEAAFLMRIGLNDQYLYSTGQITHRDLTPILQALTLRPGDLKIPTDFRAACYQALTDAYLDNAYLDKKDYANAEKYLNLALAECSQMGDQQDRLTTLACDRIALLAYKGQYADSTKLLEQYSDSQPGSANQFRQSYRTALSYAWSQSIPISTITKSLVNKNQFTELDKYVDKQRLATKPFANGYWPINSILDAIAYVPNSGADSEWEKKIELLRQWSAEKPQSIIAKTALAELYTDYAWHARGNSWARNVTDDGWNLMNNRLNKSLSMLREANKKTPEWYMVAQRVGLGQSWPASVYNNFVDGGRRAFPNFDPIIFVKIHWLLPRWFGKAGDCERYAAVEADRRGGSAGDILYARCVWYSDTTYENIFKESSFDWNRTKRGFKQILQQYPNSMVARGEFALLALEAGDKSTAQTIFQNTVPKH